MRADKMIGLAAVFIVLGLLAGCHQSDYIANIQLPAGAEVLERRFYTEGGFTPIERQVAEQSKHYITIGGADVAKEKLKFSAPGGWYTVAAAMDQLLAGRGYELVEGDELETISDSAQRDWLTVLDHRGYTSASDPVVVVFYDVTRFNQTLYGSPDSDPAASNEFALLILKLE